MVLRAPIIIYLSISVNLKYNYNQFFQVKTYVCQKYFSLVTKQVPRSPKTKMHLKIIIN